VLRGSENWTINARDCKKNNSSRDETYEKNSRIHLDRIYIKKKVARELNITSVLDKIQEYGRNWLQHL